MPLVPAGLKAALAVLVTLTAPGHAPTINTHWNYAVHATRAGKPAHAKLTATIVDPIGGSHPVEFGKSTKTITAFPFTGTFRDFIIWPPSSRGIPLELKLVVVVGRVRKTITYAVVPKGA